MPSTPLIPIKDRQLQIGTLNNLFSNDIAITPICVNATVTVGDESADVRQITVQLLDSNGAVLDYAEVVEVLLFTTQAATAFASVGGSTGIAIGATGSLLTVLAKRNFLLITTIAGLAQLTYTDTGTEACAIGIRLATGRIIMGSQLLTNA